MTAGSFSSYRSPGEDNPGYPRKDRGQTFAVIDAGIKEKERLCLLVERGSFWGMGYLPASEPVISALALKNFLQPYADNDYIRNSIYSFADANPHKRISLQQ